MTGRNWVGFGTLYFRIQFNLEIRASGTFILPLAAPSRCRFRVVYICTHNVFCLVVILQDSTESAIWQIDSLRNLSAVHNIYLLKRYHNTLSFCCLDNKNSILCRSFFTINLHFAKYCHYCIHILKNDLATNWNDHFQNHHYIGNKPYNCTQWEFEIEKFQ